MNDNNDGVLKFFLGTVIVVMIGFMGWAVMEHYKDHDEHLRNQYDQRMIDQRHDNDHERIMRGIGNHEENDRSRDSRHRSYYCPTCRGYHQTCPHQRQYDPYHNNGYYYCPTCRRMTRGCSHARHYNPYFGLEIQIR